MNKATIYYCDIGDYLSREEKFAILRKNKSIANMQEQWQILTPNEHGDWLNQRTDTFSSFIPLEPEKKFDIKTKSFFLANIVGVVTSRDAWVLNFSKEKLTENMRRMIDFYNEQSSAFTEAKKKNLNLEVEKFIDTNETKISWSVNLKKDIERGKIYQFNENENRIAMYRPFTKHWLYYEKSAIERPGLWSQIFPTKEHKNLAIAISGIGVSKDFSVLITDMLSDLSLCGATQCFPLYYYEEIEISQANLIDQPKEEYVKRDAISNFILERAKTQYGKNVNKEDIFYYVYGFLHSPQYREKFGNDLKKMLPRLPLIDDARDFWNFSRAGRELAQIHLNYENPQRHSDIKVFGEEENNFFVQKMRFPKKDQKDTIIYNNYIRIENIPAQVYEYIVNGKSAVEWVMERYQITTHKDSGIKNDPNDWAREIDNPRYILDLLLSVINLSAQTVEIVKNLPKVNFEE